MRLIIRIIVHTRIGKYPGPGEPSPVPPGKLIAGIRKTKAIATQPPVKSSPALLIKFSLVKSREYLPVVYPTKIPPESFALRTSARWNRIITGGIFAIPLLVDQI
jgi:hypothetical protein